MITNLNYINSITDSNQGMIRELIGIFKDQVGEMSSQMQTLLDKKEYELLARIAHKAKSSVSVLGMEDMASDLKNLELWANERKNTESYAVIVEKFIFVTEQALVELKEYL